MKLSLRQIEVFVAVARDESVSRAAATLNMSQSAASTALAELERSYETQLFDRVGKRLKLNGLGQTLLAPAVNWLEQAQALEQVLRGQHGFGTLQIGATLTVGNYLATLIVADFLQQYPESHVQLHVENTAHIVDAVAAFSLDLGLIEGNCQHPELMVEPWVEDELVVFCAPHHPLARTSDVDINILLAQDWIIRERGSGTREAFEHAFGDRLSQLKVRLELEHTEAIKRAAEFGLGIGCISRLALREAFQRGSLVPVASNALNLKRHFHFIWHRQKYQTAGMQAFLALCRRLTDGLTRSDQIAWPKLP
ncbi:MAG TPA: LysR family transcriptional regulator [Rhodocyclaceae bacterium]|nr:LysR family transcriptional regulator [Rhodocyclaceae bacterium]